MNESNIEIINQLKSIKKWIAVGSFGFLLLGAGISLFSLAMINFTSVIEEDFSNEKSELEIAEISWESASNLFQQNKTE